MADIKTHLREISFALKIGLLIGNRKFPVDIYEPNKFFEYADTIISNGIKNATNILIDSYDDELINIINNGFKLADSIFNSNHFIFNSFDKICWTGSDTQKDDLADVIIGDYEFSLKEDSFILENMGLYKLLNLLTGKKYKRGLHVFTAFANDEYETWFKYSWEKLILFLETKQFLYNSKTYTSKIYTDSLGMIIFEYKNEQLKFPTTLKSWSEYMELSTSNFREKVFSKWIAQELYNDTCYNKLKNTCSIVAGKNLVSEIKNNLNTNNISRLLQIYSKSYYYAKTTNNFISVYKVPSKSEFNKIIEIEDITYSVPKSQLNIITKIKNTKTNLVLSFRNECRFSHGQFNGTPEAKLYYDSGSDLSVIYLPISL